MSVVAIFGSSAASRLWYQSSRVNTTPHGAHLLPSYRAVKSTSSSAENLTCGIHAWLQLCSSGQREQDSMPWTGSRPTSAGSSAVGQITTVVLCEPAKIAFAPDQRERTLVARFMGGASLGPGPLVSDGPQDSVTPITKPRDRIRS